MQDTSVGESPPLWDDRHPADLQAVGRWYRRFDQLSDGEVMAELAAAPRP
jgi:predicted phosphoribosyltransferase